MIAYVSGEVVARGTDHVVVDVRGVGYKVFVPRHPSGDKVALHTHHVVRDDLTQRAAKGWRHRHVSERWLARAARNGTEMALDHGAGFIAVEIARDGEYRVVGRVVRREEVRDVVEAGRIEIGHGTDERMMKRVANGKGQGGESLPPGAVRLIVH